MSILAKEIAFTGYPVTDIQRSRNFYGKVLGFQETMAVDFGNGQWWIEYDIGNGTFAISNCWPPSGGSGPVIAFEVVDYDVAYAHLLANGVPVIKPTYDSPVCRMSILSDPDGNCFTLHQRKETAACSCSCHG